ncbi:histidine kinase [Alsobacter metallidurans]|uniref:histidine kinase n=1 Tax=Alsobacter metallidurans TaxID=340221 RepID=A0A917IB33_9HYPH|nr:HWE histidine kinase domain-containing protein [Alsobacter metallidurans]GGH28136.1 histidine kinase [Alsobacter metallidurans]
MASNNGTVAILLVEDSELDADLATMHLRRSGLQFTIKRVEEREAFTTELMRGGYDLILSDFSLPRFDGMAALSLARELAPNAPFIFVSGVLGEEIAIESLKQGATDYVLKPRLERLGPAVQRALRESEAQNQRRRAEERTRLLVAELSHRVKNTLMTVISIAQQTMRRSDSLKTFETAFLGRMHALAGAHSLLLRANWGDMDLEELLSDALKAFRRGDGRHVILQGEPVRLPPQHALTVNLIIHELATNAAKYGALASDGGRIFVDWAIEQRDGDDHLRLTWREQDGPPVKEPLKRGFGSTLIQRSVGFELGGTVSLDFPETGVVCVLQFPLTPEQRDIALQA